MKLEVKRLSFSYSHKKVLDDLTFSVEKGVFVSVLGPNGAGKSTLFRCILKFNSGWTGAVLVDGADTKTLSQKEMARRIAFIPQIHRPTFGFTVLDTVLMGTSRQLGAFSMPKRKQIELSYEAMERIGVAHLAHRDFDRISGGEQQLVLTARAVAQQADILIMDEPTSALDYGNQFRVLEQVRALADEGRTVLLSTHNPQHAVSFADRVLALAEGRIAALGDAGEVLTPALMRRLYGIGAGFAETDFGRVIVPEAAARR